MSDKLDLDFSWESIKARFDAENPEFDKYSRKLAGRFKSSMRMNSSISDEEYHQQIEEHRKLLKEKKSKVSESDIHFSRDNFVLGDDLED